ncbi:MAG: cupin domain-containing protein [Thermoanaerobaculia bacterium]|nr:cupin domain-containing protein [Thermoanaerobaculia bacterium]
MSPTPRPAVLHDVQSAPWEELTPKLSRKLVTGERTMIALLRLGEGAFVPRHAHPNEQISYVMSGRLRFVVGDDEEEIVVGPGQAVVLPSELPHSAEAIEDTVGIDVFVPPRQDWLDGDDAYLRQGAE